MRLCGCGCGAGVRRWVWDWARGGGGALAGVGAERHRAATDDGLLGPVVVSRDELDESLDEISRSPIVALDELWTMSDSGDQISLIDTIEDHDSVDPQRNLTDVEVREAIAEAIANLPEREKIVVTLYYYEELTLREIGEVLGVTESRVSQLHTKAILRLRGHLAGGSTPLDRVS